MPTVLRFTADRVIVYLGDHRPAHVHVIGAGHEAVFYLNCPVGPVGLREKFGFSRSDIQRIRQHLTAYIEQLCDAWRKIQGEI